MYAEMHVRPTKCTLLMCQHALENKLNFIVIRRKLVDTRGFQRGSSKISAHGSPAWKFTNLTTLKPGKVSITSVECRFDNFILVIKCF